MKVMVENVTEEVDEEATNSAGGGVVMEVSDLSVPPTPVMLSVVMEGRVMDAPSLVCVAESSVTVSVGGHVFSPPLSPTLALCSIASPMVVQGRSCHPQC